jgi:protocatechuate 3,4-dioxygenase beta subunit
MMTTFTKNSAKAKFSSFVLFLVILVISFNGFGQVNCSCPGNLVTNPSFESGTTGWSTNGGGTLTTGGGAVVCGNYSGDLNNTTTDSWAQQTIGTDLAVGTTINVTVYAGTHDNSFHNYVQISFYNSSNAWLSSSVTVQVDKILANAPVGPQLYTLNAVVPSGVKYTKVTFGGNGSYTKTDNWCVTTATPSSCTCPGNLVQNPSFESGTTSWGFSGGNFTAGTGAVVCGTKSGDFEITNTSSNWVSQTIGTDLPIGTILNASVYAGTHDNSVAHSVQINFFNASWTFISAVSIPVNKILGNAPVGPQLYTFTATVPANTKYTQAVFGGHGGWIKTDNWCITSTPGSGTGSIGDRVWGDANGNGIQDAGETNGFTGVTVQLKNAAGIVIATTTTNGTGNYLFSGLAAGNYSVVFPVSLSGATVTGQNVGGDDAIDSDASQTTGETGVISLSAGQNITNVDAGYCPTTLQLGNRVWNDVNNDGLNAGELGIAGVTVNLYKDNDNNNIADGAIIATTTTDADGFYLFSGLVPGNYIVGVVRPTGFVSSAVNGGDPDNDINFDDNGQITVGNETRGLTITLIGGTEPDGTNTNTDINITYDFGFVSAPTGSIGDRVWFDANGNGIQDATETTPITGVSVQLKNAAGTVIATTTTNATGNYLFSGLVAGNYTVVFPISISGATVTTANVGADDNVDSDASQVTGETGTISLAAGQNITNVDAGYCPTILALGDRVYFDLNNNGVREATELGIEGLTVNLYKDNNNDNVADGPSIANTLTNATGNYRFDNLVPGNYIVGVTPPAGYSSSTNAAIDPDNDVDLDDNGTNLVGTEWRGLAITLTGGAETLETGNFNNTYDFGFYPTASIGDFVWNDLNGNGVQDAGEPGITGVTVNLLNSAGTIIATTTTNASGAYNFPNVAPGTYSVTFTTPAGYTPTGSNLGGNDATDSDPIGGTVTGIVITAGISNTTIDAGFRGTGVIGNFVWNDSNGNGIQDPGETGIQGVVVTLRDAAGNVVATTTTDVNGTYSFTNVPPGTYCVAYATPTGYTPTTSNAPGSTGANNSDPVGGVACGIVVNGNVNNDVDAGFFEALNLGNTVWYDQNNDGTKQPTESGISAATVRLYLDANNDNVADGAAIATTITDANGLYNFANLAPGNYLVGVTIPAGYAVVTTNGGDPDNNTDNDNNGTNTSVAGEVRSSAITLTSGAEPTTDGDGNNGNLTIDFGLKGTGLIGDFVFNDVNGNGIQDAGEGGLPGVTVSLLNPNGTTTTTTTDANGNYSFPNLAPGSYSVTFTTPSGLTASPSNQGGNDGTDSDPVGGTVTGIVLTAGQVNNTVDAGFFAANVMNLGNVVWYDQNNDGIKQPTETGIAAATVRLYLDANNDNVADGAAIATTTTDANGLYNFGGLAAGNYIVGVTIPTGYAVVTTNGGDPDNNTDNDNNGTNTSVVGEVRSSAITLALTTEPTTDGDGNNGNLTVDFGFRGTGSIGNFVFNDVNANGIQDATETGIPGATVLLTNPNGTTTSTTTDANGLYSFSNLAPGTYSVAFTTPAGYNVSPSNVTTAGATDANDSDPVGGVVTGIVLTAGQVNETVDAGFFICLPLNSGINGPAQICAGEPAVFNATGAGSGSVYTWSFMSGTPATATGINVSSTWSVPGEYDINLTVTKNGCTSSYVKSIVITSSVFANAGPDADICSGSSTTINGSGPLNSTYSWIVIAGDPTSIDNGANASSILVSPLTTTTYQLTVSQNGCTKIDQVTVFINVNKNPVADAGSNKTVLLGSSVVIGGSPTGTPPLATPSAALGYIWSPTTALNSNTTANPTVTPTVVGTTNYRVIVYSLLTACSDTAFVNVTAIQPVNVGNNVWYDKNNNGIKEAGEPGVSTTVRLYEDANNDNVPDGGAIATTTTVNGAYSFTNLFPGNYIVGAIIPAGYAVVTTNGGDPDNDTDNDNNGTITTVPGEVRSATVTLTEGGEPLVGVDGNDNNGNLTVDFGLTGTAQLGNFVWYDNDRDGIQDAGEAGIPNTTVTLTYPDGGTLITTTNAIGAYNFGNLAPGSYSISFSTPVGLIATLSNSSALGATDNNDSDPVGGIVSGINLTAGEINNSVDAGFHNICTNIISGNVWNDLDADNGIDSIGASTRPIIPNGLVVSLVSLSTGRVINTSLVNGFGQYSLNNVPVGNYSMILSTLENNIGDLPPAAVLPNRWFYVGESNGLDAGGVDILNNGSISFNKGSLECVTNINFGIKFSNQAGGID